MDDPMQPKPAAMPWLSLAAEFHIASLAAITLAMTAYTHNLDDIKTLIFFVVGPILAVGGLGLIASGHAPAPKRLLTYGLALYAVVLLVSMLISKYSYLGWDQCLYNWAWFGFLISALAIGSSRESGETALRGIVGIMLIVNIIGFFMYNFTGAGSGIKWLYTIIYPSGDQYVGPDPSQWYRLLMTFAGPAQNDLQSTILGSDYYQSVCLYSLPLAMALAIDPGDNPSSRMWRGVAFATTILTTVSILLTRTLFGYPIFLVSVFLLPALFLIGNKDRSKIAIGLCAAMIAAVVIVVALRFDLFRNFSSTATSFKARLIIWSGAWEVFTHHPLLGGGPGSFRIYFPEFRDPHYYSVGVGHVTTNAFNHWLDILSETGLAGLMAFFMILAGVLLPAARSAFSHPDPQLRSRNIAGLVAAIAIICSISISPTNRWVVGGVWMWTILGLIAGWGLQAAKNEAPAPAPRFSVRMGIGVAFALVMLPLCLTHGSQYYSAALEYARGVQKQEIAMAYVEREVADHAMIDALFEDAIGYFKKTIAIEPKNASAYYKLGSALMTLHSSEIEKANAAKKDNNLKQSGIHDATAKRLLDESRNAYEQLAAINPDYAQIHYNLGIVYNTYHELLTEEIAQTSNTTELKAEAEKYHKLALEEYEKNYKSLHAKDNAIGYIGVLISFERYAEALPIAQEWSDREPEDEWLAEVYAALAIETKNREAIPKARERLKAVKPNSKYLK